MNNNFMSMIMGMMSQAGNNPQNFISSLLQNNPQFANSLQGQNPKALAMQELQKRGIDPNMIIQMLNKR